jgi:hypothetical protein
MQQDFKNLFKGYLKTNMHVIKDELFCIKKVGRFSGSGSDLAKSVGSDRIRIHNTNFMKVVDMP